MTPITHETLDWSDAAFDALVAMCTRLETNPAWVLGFMFSESGCHAWAVCRSKAGNPVAVGLNQLLCQRSAAHPDAPSNLEAAGWSLGVAQYLSATPAAQLPTVERYFAPHKGQMVSLDACYLVNFLPADIAHGGDPAFILVDPRPASPRREEFYAWNPGLDHDAKGYITVGDLGLAVQCACIGDRWTELSGRLADAVARV